VKTWRVTRQVRHEYEIEVLAEDEEEAILRARGRLDEAWIETDEEVEDETAREVN
jgi:hypothetical protein